MEWKQFHHLPSNTNEWRLILDTITMDEATVAATIKALMTMPRPGELYWALVGAVSELGDIKKRAYAEAAERARRSQRWEDAKWSNDTNGFETSGSAKADGADFDSGGRYFKYDDFFADAFRRMQEDILRAHREGHARDAFGYGFKAEQKQEREAPKAKTNYTGRDWWVVIGCSKTADRATIKSAYRKRAMAIHQGGEGEDALKELNVAKDLAFKLVLS